MEDSRVYWFVAEQRLTVRHWERMREMARGLLVNGVQQRWAYVSCLAPCRPGFEEERYREREAFLTAAVPEFQLATGVSGPGAVSHLNPAKGSGAPSAR